MSDVLYWPSVWVASFTAASLGLAVIVVMWLDRRRPVPQHYSELDRDPDEYTGDSAETRGRS